MNISSIKKSSWFLPQMQPLGWVIVIAVLSVGVTGLNAQHDPSPVFPEDRHQELMEELDFTPPELEEEEPEEEVSSDDWSAWEWEAWEFDLSSGATWAIFGTLLVLLGFIIYRILGDISLRKRTRGEGDELEEVNVNDIEEERLVAEGVSLSLLERAERAGQYDVAVRLMYLQLLKELQDAGLIKYRKDFSNRDYQHQLRGREELVDFRTVTDEYERYWFGKYPIDRLSYRNTYQRFQVLNDRIRSTVSKADKYA